MLQKDTALHTPKTWYLKAFYTSGHKNNMDETPKKHATQKYILTKGEKIIHPKIYFGTPILRSRVGNHHPGFLKFHIHTIIGTNQ